MQSAGVERLVGLKEFISSTRFAALEHLAHEHGSFASSTSSASQIGLPFPHVYFGAGRAQLPLCPV